MKMELFLQKKIAPPFEDEALLNIFIIAPYGEKAS
jgi:hypothetical protein